MLSSFACLGLQVVFSPQVFPPKPCMHLSSISYMLHAPPVSVSVAFTAPLLTNSTCDFSFRVYCSQTHVALATCHTHCRTVSYFILKQSPLKWHKISPIFKILKHAKLYICKEKRCKNIVPTQKYACAQLHVSAIYSHHQVKHITVNKRKYNTMQ
jgi:hypothetical protein